jgi:hypothetical protein
MQLALWLVALYPNRWRRRYEGEMLALLEQHHITVWTLLDLLFGMITARLDPQYRSEASFMPARGPRRAMWAFLTGAGVFVLFAQMAMLTIDDGMSRLFTGAGLQYLHPALMTPGWPEPVMNYLVGVYIWDNEPPFTTLVFAAVTLLVVTLSLGWAIRQRHAGFILLAAVCFSLPLAALAWLLRQPIAVEFQLYGFTSTAGQLSTLGELEALMGVVFLSIVKGTGAISTHRYKLLGLVLGVDLYIALVGIYLIHTLALFPLAGAPADQQVQLDIQVLGLVASLLPFAAVGMVLLAVGGSRVSEPVWPVVLSAASAFTAVMVIYVVFFAVAALGGWSWGGWDATPWFPAPWLPAPFNHVEAVGVELLSATCLAVVALLSMFSEVRASVSAQPATTRDGIL